MTQHTSTRLTKARRVVLWTVASYVAAQGVITCLPGYPWPAKTTPEIAIRTERFRQTGSWLRDTPALEESVIQWQLHHALKNAPPQDVVFVGDSSCLMGIVPRQITAQTGLEAWNLGTMASLSSAGHAEILNLYLHRHTRKPKLVVCYFAPPTLGRTRQEVDEKGVYNHLQEWLHGADTGKESQAPLAQLPAYRLRRPVLLTANKLLSGGNAPVIQEAKRDKFPSDSGVGQVLLETHGYLKEPRRNQLPQLDPELEARIPTDESLVGIERMFALSHDLSIRLLVVFSPAPEKHRGAANEAMHRRIAERLQALAATYGNVRIHAPILRYYPDQSFGSLNHLTEEGARRNSDELARIIAGELSDVPASPRPVRGGTTVAAPDADAIRRR